MKVAGAPKGGEGRRSVAVVERGVPIPRFMNAVNACHDHDLSVPTAETVVLVQEVATAETVVLVPKVATVTVVPVQRVANAIVIHGRRVVIVSVVLDRRVATVTVAHVRRVATVIGVTGLVIAVTKLQDVVRSRDLHLSLPRR